MKIVVLVLFIYELSTGSVFLKTADIGHELQLQNNVLLNDYMLDQEIRVW